jgi:uncharacterized protein YggT (Ycf19 family)
LVELVRLLKAAVYILLNFIQVMLFLRAILSWLPLDFSHGINRFLRAMTEPILYPFRLFFDKTGIYRKYNIPLDLSFIAAYFVIWLIQPIFM